MDWEQCYIDNNTPWDLDAASPELERILAISPLEGKVVVPGAGRAHDAAAIAGCGTPTVTALDISSTAVTSARKRYSFPNLKIRLADLFAMPAEDVGVFDWGWEHTCYCAIDPELRPAYVTAMAALLKEEGQLMGIFFLTPWDTAEENATKGPPFGATRESILENFERAFEVIEERPPMVSPPRRENREWFFHFKKRSAASQ